MWNVLKASVHNCFLQNQWNVSHSGVGQLESIHSTAVTCQDYKADANLSQFAEFGEDTFRRTWFLLAVRATPRHAAALQSSPLLEMSVYGVILFVYSLRKREWIRSLHRRSDSWLVYITKLITNCYDRNRLLWISYDKSELEAWFLLNRTLSNRKLKPFHISRVRLMLATNSSFKPDQAYGVLDASGSSLQYKNFFFLPILPLLLLTTH